MKFFYSIALMMLLFISFEVQAQSTEIKESRQEVISSGTTITPSDSAEKFSATALDELKAKAANGDVDAQLNLGYIYLYGVDGTNIDYKQALSYYEAAAAQNSAVAYNNLGSLYYSGVGTGVDVSKALHFFEEAAKLGSDDAAVNLAIISLSAGPKNKTDDDYKKIFSLLQQAQKNNIAKFLLGYAYAKGFVVPQDNKKAFQLIKIAADDQYDEAQAVLADFYIHGRGTAKNYNRAVQYLRMAADQGNSGAIMQLADILAEGKIYTKDIKQAHIFYNVASVMGAADAAEKRDALESNLKIEDLLAIQALAEDYKMVPSKQTLFVRQTFGDSLKAYIDAYDNVNETKK
ncbi:MAG: sel1 repeat family protein [Alphaproteobacteria bacterium]|nr:sel1 repeat family protein [Alphaproteobacteria bacterium]